MREGAASIVFKHYFKGRPFVVLKDGKYKLASMSGLSVSHNHLQRLLEEGKTSLLAFAWPH